MIAVPGMCPRPCPFGPWERFWGQGPLLRIERVIDAHRVLMSLNEQNEETFKDLVNALEAEAQQPSPLKTGS